MYWMDTLIYRIDKTKIPFKSYRSFSDHISTFSSLAAHTTPERLMISLHLFTFCLFRTN